MLLREIYEKKHYAIVDEDLTWQEAIKKCCEPLEAAGIVKDTYAGEIIACIEKHGPYVVILPGIALPHSTENAEGAIGTAIGFMYSKRPVAFEPGNPDKDAQIFFTLSSTNPDEHLENMQRLYTVLTNEEALAALREIEKPEDLLKIDQLVAQQ